MPFADLETVTKHNMPPRAKISYMPSQRATKAGGKARPEAKPQLIITLPTTICGAAKATHFVLQIGTGGDRGKLRLKGSKSKDKGVEPKELMHAFVFRFGYVPKLGDEHFDGEHRPVKKIGEDEFEIEIPDSWFEE